MSFSQIVSDYFPVSRLLKVDNNGQEQIAESLAMDNEGYRVDLTSAPNTFTKTTSYTTTQGHTVSTYILKCE